MCFLSFLCTSRTTVATGAPLHIRRFTLVGKGLSTALCATQEGCPKHPSTSSPEAGSYRASTYLRQHSSGDIHHFPSVFLQDSTSLGRRQVPHGSAAVGSSASLPHPRQGCGSHQPLPPAATSHQRPAASGKSTWFSSPPAPCAFSPPVHLLGHTETTSASPFIKLLPVAVLQWELGSVQLGPGPHTGLSLELGPAI